jgi:tetratricopeptide (TPR) repeat protein
MHPRSHARTCLVLLLSLMFAGCRTSSSSVPAFRRPARQSSARGKPGELVTQAAAAVQAGQSEIAIEKYKAALDEVQQQDKLKRGTIELSLGITYQKAGRWQESADALNAGIRDNQTLGYLPYALLGFSYSQLGRWQESLIAFQQAAKLNPDGIGVQAGLGAALTALGKPREAIKALQKAVSANPTLAINHIDLGMAYSQGGQLDGAIREFNEALRLEPSNALAYLELGEAFGKKKQFDDEIAAELHAISLNPKLAQAHYLLGTAYGVTNRLPEAAAEYAEAADGKADYLDAYAGLALVDNQLQRRLDSLKALQAVERLDGTSTNYAAYLSLANSYQTFNLWQQTVNSASRAISLNPECVLCYCYLGNGYQNLGRSEEAKKAYQRALAIQPNYSAALMGLGQLVETSGDFTSAEKYFDAASRSLGQSPSDLARREIEGGILVERGNIERDRGNYAEAFGLYTRAVEAYRSIAAHKDAGWTLAKIAETYWQIGDYPVSAQWYDYAFNESQQAQDVDAQITALLRLCFLAVQIGDRSALAKYAQQGEQLLTIVRGDRSKALPLITGEYGLAYAQLLAIYGAPSDAIKALEPLVM